MTLGDLKEMIDDLERLEGEHVLDMDVYAEYDYGDHCHTRALTVINNAETVRPYKSSYSDTGLAISDKEDRADRLAEVVVLTRR